MCSKELRVEVECCELPFTFGRIDDRWQLNWPVSDVEMALRIPCSSTSCLVLSAATALDESLDMGNSCHLEEFVNKVITGHDLSVLIARSPYARPEALKASADDCDPKVRRAVAANAVTQHHLLEMLADDCDPKVRHAVAANEETPEELLLKLSEDAKSVVRAALAANEETPEELLLKLSEDPILWVRREVAANAASPEKSLRRLAEDPESTVSHTAARSLTCQPQEN